MMCVTLELLTRGAALNVAECLRLERTLVRRCFEHREILEGVRALVIDKDNAPRWNPARLEDVTPEMVARYFRAGLAGLCAPATCARLDFVDHEQTPVFAHGIAVGHAGDVIGNLARLLHEGCPEAT